VRYDNLHPHSLSEIVYPRATVHFASAGPLALAVHTCLLQLTLRISYV
jgi:hypothetical protein